MRFAQTLRGGDYIDPSAGMGAALTRRLRASERLSDHVASLACHHVRLGSLPHEMPLSRRAVYRSLCTRARVQADMTVLSVDDRPGGRRASQ